MNSSFVGSLDPINISVTPVLSKIRGKAPRVTLLGSATGFFFSFEGIKYLITNRHVVINEEDDYFPDLLEIKVHNNRDNIEEVRTIEIELYDEEKQPIWLKHPNLEQVDIVAINLHTHFESSDIINCLRVTNIQRANASGLSLEDDANIFIIGYPLAFYDEVNNLPVKRGCTIASRYGIHFDGEPFFLVDARIHEGISGSPVFTPIFISQGSEEMQMSIDSLLGVFSGEYEVGGIELGLGVVWYPELIHEILVNQSVDSIRELE